MNGVTIDLTKCYDKHLSARLIGDVEHSHVPLLFGVCVCCFHVSTRSRMAEAWMQTEHLTRATWCMAADIGYHSGAKKLPAQALSASFFEQIVTSYAALWVFALRSSVTMCIVMRSTHSLRKAMDPAYVCSKVKALNMNGRVGVIS